MRRDQALCEDFGLDFFRADSLPGIQGAHTFKQSLFESATDSHDLADRLHLGTETLVDAGELLKLPFGNLHHHVVKRGLKASGGLAGDVVWDFVEGVADRKLGGDFGNWEPRGLGS